MKPILKEWEAPCVAEIPEIASNTVSQQTARKMSKGEVAAKMSLREVVISKLETLNYLEEPIRLAKDISAFEFNNLDLAGFRGIKLDWVSKGSDKQTGDVWLVEMPTPEHNSIIWFIDGVIGPFLKGNQNWDVVGLGDVGKILFTS